MKRDADFFEGKETQLVYIAKKLREALALESLLTGAGVDYLVEADRYKGGIIFQTERVGAFFYVLPDTVSSACEVMASNGYTPIEAGCGP